MAQACASGSRSVMMRPLLWGAGIFALLFLLPVGWGRFDRAVVESLALVRWYAREHVLLCLLPAFFIAGAMGVFISRQSVMRYLGPSAHKAVAYAVASVSGSVLAVCSCTILPLFAGIWRMGAGLGPAVTFLYAGPAINVLAIILTATVLGPRLGIARAVGAVVFSIVIGLIMQWLYRHEQAGASAKLAEAGEAEPDRPLWQTVMYFAIMVGILVFANWGKPSDAGGAVWWWVWSVKWPVTAVLGAVLGIMLVSWFNVALSGVLLTAAAVSLSWAVMRFGLIPYWGDYLPGADLPYAAMVPFTVGVVGLSWCLLSAPADSPARAWFDQSWSFAVQIMPLLLAGVLVAGLLLGQPGGQGLIPGRWVSWLVGGNSLQANAFASVLGALMYFATLTEVPVIQGLMLNGMGKGPALALLLAGPALSLPNMLVIRSVMGTQKTLVFVVLVVVMSTLAGWLYGTVF